MSLEQSDQVGSIRLGRGAYSTIDRLDGSSQLGVAVKEFRIAAHVGLGRAAHHSRPHHPATTYGLQGIAKHVATGKPQSDQGPAGGQQTERCAPRDASHGPLNATRTLDDYRLIVAMEPIAAKLPAWRSLRRRSSASQSQSNCLHLRTRSASPALYGTGGRVFFVHALHPPPPSHLPPARRGARPPRP